MEQEERWNQFAASGKVMDYLRYRESVNGSGKNQRNDCVSSSYHGEACSFSSTSTNSTGNISNYGRYE